MEKQEMNQSAEKKKFSFSQMWNNKRLRPVLISAAVILLCVAVYLVLLFTVLKPEEEEAMPTEGNHGEMMENGRPFVIDPIESTNIQYIEVENEKGGYRYYRGTDGKYYFKDAEFMFYDENAAWNQEGFSEEQLQDLLSTLPITTSLVNMVSYMLSDQEVVGYDANNLASYGLADKGAATLTVNYLDDDGKEVTQTVHFGNRAVSGKGYYCMVEGRDALYILADDYNAERCLFVDERAFMFPQVALNVSSATYTEVDRFSIKKNGEDFLSLRAVSEEEFEQNGELFTHVFENPEGYYPSADNLQTVLYTFVNFTGEEVMEYGITNRLADPAQRENVMEMFRLYSLMDQDNKWNYELSYSYPDFDCTLYISKKLELSTGTEEEEKEYVYYVYSPDFDCIVEFKAEDLEWVEWDLLKYMDNHSFAVSIDSVSTIELKYEGVDTTFTLTGTSNELKVKNSGGVAVNTDNFRQLYKAILFTTMDGYADQPENSDSILNLKITLRDGKVYDYAFYGLTARKAYYSLNGEGQFYINRDYVKQMMSACSGILAGETVTVERKN